MNTGDMNKGGMLSTARRNRTPVASADGTSSARLNDSTSGKRKRVRITTSDVETDSKTTSRFSTKSFGDVERSSQRGAFERSRGIDRDGYRDLGATHRRSHRENNEENGLREEYQKRYKAQRDEGNYDFNYNRSVQGTRDKSVVRPKAGGYKAKKKDDSVAIAKKNKAKSSDFRAANVPLEPIKYPQVLSPDTEIRLNKYLANAGICSRREADNLIAKGEVSVNGEVVTELGRRVTPLDVVTFNGIQVESQSKVYILLNKPKNCVTTSDDPECRLTVMDIVRNACPERTYPVGRLDRQTTGVLLITNDGDLAAKLTHPSFMKKKIYHVWLDKPVSIEHMQAIADGFELEDGEIHADALSYVTEEDMTQVGIEIHSGRNRIVRRIFEHFGYQVQKLDRVYFAGLTKKNLPRGKWRYLNEQEVNNLRMGSFE